METRIEDEIARAEPVQSGSRTSNGIIEDFRRWGYLQAKLDPLGQYLQPQAVPELDVTGPIADKARKLYCGTAGIEFMHIADGAKRRWIQERFEREEPRPDQQRILDLLVRADIFEQVLQARYPGTKRFSLEGVTVLIPFLDTLLHCAAERGMSQTILAMSHRGRLNVMANVIGSAPAAVFSKFEDIDPRSVLGSGDVKYHIGATGQWKDAGGSTAELHLVSNPSHLESVDPVAMGRTRAKQARFGSQGEDRVLPVFIHGDAAFAGQGISAETLNLASVVGFSVGGSVHVLANNLIGFTAGPAESNSSLFASDVAKRLAIPVLHVNAEDPDTVVRAATFAADYRYTFHTDVLVDLIGYRRYGHSEIDDPTITQPVRYARIKDHPPLHKLYAKQIGVDPSSLVGEIQSAMTAEQTAASRSKKSSPLATLPAYWGPYHGGCYKGEDELDTNVVPERLREISVRLSTYPDNFHIHPKIKKLLEQRAEMGRGKRPLDYATAEALAFGSLVLDGTPVRLSGQDSRRGTFNQRHCVLIDTETETPYIPLANLAPDQARFEVYNSILSEAAVLGYEYGFSRDYPEALVLWEAQFGDFANGAQVIIDQFIAAGEEKWDLLSGLVLLLPHGYEGQGPEHSSARIERYLQLAARDNIQICQPSTAAQYFHLLRRQALGSWRKPLIAFTPKSMLRHPDAASRLDDFAAPRFQKVLLETEIKNPKRLLFCTGKIGHELRTERTRRKETNTGILFIEQLYPWPADEIAAALDRYRNAHEIVWVQEEPANMGALSFVVPRLRRLARGRQVHSVRRSAAASPATGSAKAHVLEQKTILAASFGGNFKAADQKL
ncbi:MAG TPA: 2-oxoglutarate dehydrogenase E1 component [Terracidiphilus sp.]|nr:2-oxoglutarate dehydrogenase E1 component [Terracidiphilus sp.]